MQIKSDPRGKGLPTNPLPFLFRGPARAQSRLTWCHLPSSSRGPAPTVRRASWLCIWISGLPPRSPSINQSSWGSVSPYRITPSGSQVRSSKEEEVLEGHVRKGGVRGLPCGDTAGPGMGSGRHGRRTKGRCEGRKVGSGDQVKGPWQPHTSSSW